MSLYFSVLIFHIQCCVCVWISIGFQQLVFLVFFQLVIRVTFVCLLEEPSGSCPHTCESRSELCFWLTYTHIHTQTHTHSDALPTHLHTLQIFKPQWLPETANIWHLTWVYVCEDSHHFSVTKSLKHTSQWYMHLLTEPTHMKKKNPVWFIYSNNISSLLNWPEIPSVFHSSPIHIQNQTNYGHFYMKKYTYNL